jgi:hypothetical protein
MIMTTDSTAMKRMIFFFARRLFISEGPPFLTVMKGY